MFQYRSFFIVQCSYCLPTSNKYPTTREKEIYRSLFNLPANSSVKSTGITLSTVTTSLRI